MAAAGEPVGRNANWSEKESDGGGDRKAAQRYDCTTVCSMILVNIGVIDIGRKSTCCLGTATLGIGRMLACFHCCGTADTAIERLNSVVICLR